MPLRTYLTRRERVEKWATSTRKKFHTAVPALEPMHSELTKVRARSPQQGER